MLTNKEIEKVHESIVNDSVKCKCGHSVIYNWNRDDKCICSHCGKYVFKNKKVEFNYRMKELRLKK